MSKIKGNIMKTCLLIAVTASMLCACSSKKTPQPHGTAFPINSTIIQGSK